MEYQLRVFFQSMLNADVDIVSISFHICLPIVSHDNGVIIIKAHYYES